MTVPKMKVEMESYGVVDKIVKPLTKSSGRVYVPASWIGKRVRVVLLEEPDKDEKSNGGFWQYYRRYILEDKVAKKVAEKQCASI